MPLKRYVIYRILLALGLLTVLGLLFFLPSVYRFSQDFAVPRSIILYILSCSGIYLWLAVYAIILVPSDYTWNASRLLKRATITGLYLVNSAIVFLLCERFIPAAIDGHWWWNYGLNILMQLAWLLLPVEIFDWLARLFSVDDE